MYPIPRRTNYLYRPRPDILQSMTTRVGISASIIIFLFLVSLATACGGGNPFGVKSELVTAATRPVAMAFAPDGRLFYAEQTGNIRVVSAEGELQEEPFAQLEVAQFLEWGLTGLAIDPDFETNDYVYAYFTEEVDPGPPPTARPVVIRFTDQANRGIRRTVIVADLPETNPERPGIKATGRIHFGPDGFLYATIGDYDWGKQIGPEGKPYALDLSTAIGKIIRFDKESGEAPPDNPFFDRRGSEPRIFAYGFSGPFNFTFHPETGQLYGTDNTASCEELNLIQAGENYGWPEVGEFADPDCTFGEQVKGIHFFALEGSNPGDLFSGVGVSGLAFVSGDVYPLLGDSLLISESQGRLMRRLVLSGSDLDQVVVEDDVVVQNSLFDIAISPDGIVYYSNETEIRRLLPEPE